MSPEPDAGPSDELLLKLVAPVSDSAVGALNADPLSKIKVRGRDR